MTTDSLHDHTEPYRREMAARLRAASRARGGSRWHDARADGLLRRPETVAACGTVVAAVATCAAGAGRVAMRRCGDRHACSACASRAARRAYARMVESIDRARRGRAHGRGRSRDVLRLLTLTVRHTGDLRRDRDRIQRAWHRHRAWLRSCAGVRPAYWSVWEVTPGRDGRGHVHLHVILLAPWYDYARAHAAWCAHADGESQRYDARAVRTRDAARAVSYLAGYLSAGAKDAAWRAADPALRAAWWAASYGRRVVSAHRGAWSPRTPAPCPCCGVAVMWVAPPRGTERDPAAAMAAVSAALAAGRHAPDGGYWTCHEVASVVATVA